MLILASGSPRRKELLKKITSDFRVVVSDVDEKSIHANARELPVKISKMKAYAVFSQFPEDIILASDTVVLLNNEIVGKPTDQEDAKRILKRLSGKEHLVITGYTIISKNYELSRSVVSKVHFKELSDELIERYVRSGSPMDKAGAYGIQDKDFPLVDHIEGSYDNVMGFPTEDIIKHLKIKAD